MKRLLLILAGTSMYASIALAHHSSAMFEEDKRLTLTGTVREFQWHNPHVYIQLMVKNAKGADEEWSLEMAAPMYLYNHGWRPSSVKTGDKITATIKPLRNGSKGGLVMEALDAKGTRIGKP